jgi:hypothetical protein
VNPVDRRARIEELLADRALVGLSPPEQEELNRLLAESNVKDDTSYDLAASSTDLAALGGLEAAPPHLMAKVQADADRFFAAKKSVESRRAVDRRTARIVAEPQPASSPVRSISTAPPKRSRALAVAPWAIAAAFALIAIGSWWTRPRDVARIDRSTSPSNAPSNSPPTPPKKSLIDQRAELLAKGGDVQTLPFTATKDPGGVGASGDVVWSSAEQRGFMRFHALTPNDPSKSQYQLWIFDADRDDAYPVDGGVFDVDASTGDVVVEIVPKIAARRPKLFAITIERPGGVVVSKREHIVLTASI